MIGAADWTAAVDFLRRYDRLLLCSHIKPDADTIGSALGLGHALLAAGKRVTHVCADPLSPSLNSLPGAERFLTAPPDAPPDGQSWDAVVALDASTVDRLGPVLQGAPFPPLPGSLAHRHPSPSRSLRSLDSGGGPGLLRDWSPRPGRGPQGAPGAPGPFAGLPLLNIDHHITNPGFGSVNLVDGEAAATAELVTLLLERMGLPISVPAATCLMAGILTDTLSFQTEGTTSRTLRVAATLLDAGAPLAPLAYRFFRQRGRGSALVWSAALGTLRFAAAGRVAWIEVSRAAIEGAGSDADSAGLSGFAASIEGVAVSFALEEAADGTIFVSLRSPVVDVAAIAGRFGGGGHARAAGCQFPPPATLASARDALLAVVEPAVAGEPAVEPALAAGD